MGSKHRTFQPTGTARCIVTAPGGFPGGTPGERETTEMGRETRGNTGRPGREGRSTATMQIQVFCHHDICGLLQPPVLWVCIRTVPAMRALPAVTRKT